MLCVPLHLLEPILHVVIGLIGLVSRHLGSLLGVIRLTILCAFVRKVGHFDAQIKETLLYM
jgi:hypothetical protein